MFDEYKFTEIFHDDPEHFFLTVCDKADALWEVYGIHGIKYACLNYYTQDEYQKIRQQADEWLILNKCEEFYSNDAYANLGGEVISNHETKIDDRRILVKNDVFIGIVYFVPHQDSKALYACVADYQGEPLLLFKTNYSYTPDDIEAPSVRDEFYLVKKTS